MQDVRTCAAYCLSHILKIHAPDSPYSTAQLQVPQQKHIASLFFWASFACLFCCYYAVEIIMALYTDSACGCHQDVFGLFMWVFRRLGNPSSPSYQLTLSVLDNVSQVLYTQVAPCGVFRQCVAVMHTQLHRLLPACLTASQM